MRYSSSLAPPHLEDLRNMVLPTALRVAGRNDRRLAAARSLAAAVYLRIVITQAYMCVLYSILYGTVVLGMRGIHHKCI